MDLKFLRVGKDAGACDTSLNKSQPRRRRTWSWRSKLATRSNPSRSGCLDPALHPSCCCQEKASYSAKPRLLIPTLSTYFQRAQTSKTGFSSLTSHVFAHAEPKFWPHAGEQYLTEITPNLQAAKIVQILTVSASHTVPVSVFGHSKSARANLRAAHLPSVCLTPQGCCQCDSKT